MDTKEFISVELFCLHHDVEITFINSLQEFDLIEVVQLNQEDYIHLHHCNLPLAVPVLFSVSLNCNTPKSISSRLKMMVSLLNLYLHWV